MWLWLVVVKHHLNQLNFFFTKEIQVAGVVWEPNNFTRIIHFEIPSGIRCLKINPRQNGGPRPPRPLP